MAVRIANNHEEEGRLKAEVAKDAGPIIHSDGTEVTGDVTVTISGASKVGAYCLGIEHGMIQPTSVWTWGK